MTDWQAHYESGETPWNRGGPSPALVQWLETHRMHGSVLVPGCGHGHDLAALAGSGAEEVIGLDIAPGGVAAAQERTGGLTNVRVICGDLFTWCHAEGQRRFDWVFEHTCFCAIPRERRNDYVAAVAAALKPRAHLLAVFYLKPWDNGQDQMQGPPFGSEIEELDARFGADFELLESHVPNVSYPGREGKELVRLLRRK
jgi:methyl halide transferase